MDLKKNYTQKEIEDFFQLPSFEEVPIVITSGRILCIQVLSVEKRLKDVGIQLPSTYIKSLEGDSPYVVYRKAEDVPILNKVRDIVIGDIIIQPPHMQYVEFDYKGRGFKLIYHQDIIGYTPFEDFMQSYIKIKII